MGRVKRVDVGGIVYHVLNRPNVRSALFKSEGHYQAPEKVPDTFSPYLDPLPYHDPWDQR